MNATTSVTAIGQQPCSDRYPPDVFRSRLINKFAQIETWAVGRLRAAAPGKKLPLTLGLKLGAVRELTETHGDLFRQATKTAQLIEELRPFQELRSTVAHSTLTVSRVTAGQCVAVFDPANADGGMPWRDRVVLIEDDFGKIIRRLSDLANQLSQQVPAI